MPSRHWLATPAKQPVNAPPADSGLADTIWVKNQCPPLEGSKIQDGSPPLLQFFLSSPMILSNEITADLRFRALLKIRISPMLLVSTTDPLPAHRPWSGGSTLLKMLVVFSELSTALMPLTLVAPPLPVLMRSQPLRSGTQLTDGMGKDVVLVLSRRCWAADRWTIGRAAGGMACARSRDAETLPVWWPAAAVVLVGPVSSWQLTRQPVAAGPAKVGLNVPRLDVVTALVWA